MRKTKICFLLLVVILLLSACSSDSKDISKETLQREINEFIETSLSNGRIDDLVDIWSSEEAKTRTLYYDSLPNINGKITMGTAINPPYSCYEKGYYGGISVELVYLFCESKGYSLDVIGYSDINALVMAVSAGKCDIGGTTLTITEERKKSVDYSIKYSNNPFVVRVRKEDADKYSSLEDFSGKTVGVLAGSVIPNIAKEYLPNCKQFEYNTQIDVLYALQEKKVDIAVTNVILTSDILDAFPEVVADIELPYENPFGLIFPKTSERSSLSSVFYRTFIENNRWELFFSGILTTMEISLLSIVFGTALGFVVYYFLLRKPHKISKFFLDVVLWIIRCTPAVLFLLIFYYVIFGKSSIGGNYICVIAFTIIFASSFLGCFTSAMNTVDKGQDEVSLALGYSSRASFFKILLPQALTNLWPNYQNAVINHIKATSIVGYVAVVDVTKAGDMIRSSTYDALIPLISAAVFYFLVIFLITFFIRLIKIETDPKKRSKSRRLKGVNEHD